MAEMAALRQSVVLITSEDPKLIEKGQFGTGFIIYREQETSYILTCAHVVADVGGVESVKVAGKKATVKVMGNKKGCDLAVLAVEIVSEKWINRSPLKLAVAGEVGMDFQIAGFYTDATKTYKQAEVKGKLGEIQFIDTPEGDRTKAWDLRINKDSTQQLQSGYSGSPIFANNSEYVLGVASQLTGENKGLAISIEALKELWPERPDGLISSVTPSPNIQGNVTLVSSEHPERSRDLIPDFSEADIEIIVNDIINLNPHPNFYFWSSEGKDEKLSALLESSWVLKALSPSKFVNLDYYRGLYHLQAGQYERSIDRFKYFLSHSQVEQESPIALTTRVNLGKSYFYLADYNSALQQWHMFRKSASLLPPELKEYNMASVVWRESLIYGLPHNHNRNIELHWKSFHELCDLVDKVGVSQEKNLLFSTAYSYLIANEAEIGLKYKNAEIGLKYANALKDLLKNDFKNHLRQPMFMIAALFLEARCLSRLGDCDKAMSLTILLSLGNSFSSIDWEREIFMNNLIPGLSYQNLKATLVKQLKPRHIDYILDNSEVDGNVNDDFRYAGAGRTHQNSRPFI
jgi:tetratricopeptide (TPR) repeat protein